MVKSPVNRDVKYTENHSETNSTTQQGTEETRGLKNTQEVTRDRGLSLGKQGTGKQNLTNETRGSKTEHNEHETNKIKQET